MSKLKKLKTIIPDLLDEDEEVQTIRLDDEKITGVSYADTGGSSPDLASDDDVDQMAAEMGLYSDVDDEDPQELNVAEEINKDEEEHRYK